MKIVSSAASHRDRLVKHHHAVHRDTSLISSKAFSFTPQEIPDNILSLKVLMVYAAKKTPSTGFTDSQVPFMKVKYSKDMSVKRGHRRLQ